MQTFEKRCVSGSLGQERKSKTHYARRVASTTINSQFKNFLVHKVRSRLQIRHFLSYQTWKSLINLTLLPSLWKVKYWASERNWASTHSWKKEERMEFLKYILFVSENYLRCWGNSVFKLLSLVPAPEPTTKFQALWCIGNPSTVAVETGRSLRLNGCDSDSHHNLLGVFKDRH